MIKIKRTCNHISNPLVIERGSPSWPLWWLVTALDRCNQSGVSASTCHTIGIMVLITEPDLPKLTSPKDDGPLSSCHPVSLIPRQLTVCSRVRTLRPCNMILLQHYGLRGPCRNPGHTPYSISSGTPSPAWASGPPIPLWWTNPGRRGLQFNIREKYSLTRISCQTAETPLKWF